MISSRYATPVCVLVLLALVPTVIHSYIQLRRVDNRTTAAVPIVVVGFAGAPSSRDAGWGARRFESQDWMERVYASGSKQVLLSVIRSYDLKRLYHHPELDIAYGVGFAQSRIARDAGHPGMPVHVLRSPSTDSVASAAYLLEYDGEFIEDPVWFQIRTTGALLFRGRQQMTIFFARDLQPQPESVHDGDLPSVRLVRAAAEAFLTQPSGE